ncbi:hypothetical protein KIN20_030286 [Parelaphostrongylus tenuis]|uniref:Uncharacterized protein n=1 Tax=Parelaphostrongylus tenuis TaxID=148309 RepID=A0AAD5R3M7_PARTN|nr:hypothetical protein KIN20_030286 [Parelaphostrongylus tenuis]
MKTHKLTSINDLVSTDPSIYKSAHWVVPSVASDGETTSESQENHGIRRASLEPDLSNTNDTRGDCFLLFTYNAKTLSTDADLQTFLNTTHRIKYQVIVVQETKFGNTDLLEINDGTLVVREKIPSRNVGYVGFIVHPSVTHHCESHKIFSHRLTLLRIQLKRNRKISFINYYVLTDSADEH